MSDGPNRSSIPASNCSNISPDKPRGISASFKCGGDVGARQAANLADLIGGGGISLQKHKVGAGFIVGEPQFAKLVEDGRQCFIGLDA